MKRPVVLWIDDAGGSAAGAEGFVRALRGAGFEVEIGRVRAAGDRQALAELEAELARVEKGRRAGERRIAVAGVGRAGTLAFELACTSRRAKAAVVVQAPLLYAHLDSDHPIQPLELALNLDVPVLALFGARDESVPGQHVELLRRICDQAAKAVEIVVYTQAGRGFLDPAGPEHRASDASDAAERVIAFLRETLEE